MSSYKLLNHDAQKSISRRFFICISLLFSCLFVYYLLYDRYFDVTGTTIISLLQKPSISIEQNHSVESTNSINERKSTNSMNELIQPKLESTRFTEISPGNFAFLAIVDHRNGRPVSSNGPPAPAKPLTIVQLFQNVKETRSLSVKTNDHILSPQVRVLMAISSTSGYSCQFDNGATVPGKLYQFNENHGKQLKVYYLNCLPPNDVLLENIDNITIIHDREKKSAVVPISYRIQDERNMTDFKQTFAICVPFLFGDTYTGKHFVEFMEMNRLLGVEQISIYTNESMNGDLKRVMNAYAEEGLLEMIPFSLPVNDSKIWSYGQLLTITDCILRHTGRTEFVALHDLDEYAIPKSQNSSVPPPNRLTLLPQLFSNKKIATLRLKVHYFVLDEKGVPITFNSHQRIDHVDDRATKCILRPHYLLAQGIHYPFRSIQDSYSTGYADDKQMSLVHYKKMEHAMERIEGRYGKIKTVKMAEDKYFMDHFSNFSQIFTEKCYQFGL